MFCENAAGLIIPIFMETPCDYRCTVLFFVAPARAGGCAQCSGLLQVNMSSGTVTKTQDFYTMGNNNKCQHTSPVLFVRCAWHGA